MSMSQSDFFFFNDPTTPDIYPLSLHAALPIFGARSRPAPRAPRSPSCGGRRCTRTPRRYPPARAEGRPPRSEEHTSELQSRQYLVCRLLLEKKNNINLNITRYY